MLKRILLGNKTLFYRTIIDSSEITHIIGTGVRTNAIPFEPAFISYHLIGVQCIQRDITTVIQVTFKAIQGTLIGTRCTYLAYFPQFNQQFFSV